MLILLLILTAWAVPAFIVHHLLSKHNTKWEKMGLPVPTFDKDGIFFYSACWLVTLPVSLFIYFVFTPILKYLDGLIEGDSDDKD